MSLQIILRAADHINQPVTRQSEVTHYTDEVCKSVIRTPYYRVVKYSNRTVTSMHNQFRVMNHLSSCVLLQLNFNTFDAKICLAENVHTHVLWRPCSN